MINPEFSDYFKPWNNETKLREDLEYAQQSAANNRWEAALAVYRDMQSRIGEHDPPDIQACLRYLQGVCHLKLAWLNNPEANFSEAVAAFEDAYSFFSNDKNRKLEPVIIQNALGVSYRALAEHSKHNKPARANLLDQAVKAFETAQKLLDKALKITNPTVNPVDYIRIIQNLGNTGNALAEFQAADSNFDQVATSGTAALKLFNDGLIPPGQHTAVYAAIQYNTGFALHALAEIRDQKQLHTQALAAYQEALRHYPVNRYPVEHIHILNCMAGIHIDLAETSEQEEDLNAAVKISKIVLDILTSQVKYALGYGIILYNLGRACLLYARIRNRKAEYLTKARHYLESIPGIPDLPPASKILAATHLNLGIAYKETAAIQNPDLYLPKAVRSFEEAMEIYNEPEYPLKYAAVQGNLGDTYYAMFKAGLQPADAPAQLQNLELALAAYREAGRILGTDKSSSAYQQNQYSLANASLDLAQISREKDDAQKALRCYKELLELFNINTRPFDHAQTQTGLGDTYVLLAALADDPAALTRAVEAYETALKIYTPDLFPLEHAKTLAKLGVAYQESARFQNKEANLAKAVGHFQNALKHCPSDKYPLDNASINEKLGHTLLELAELNPKNHYTQAAQALESASKIVSFENHPQKHAEIQITLGHSYLQIYRLQDAELYLSKARTAFEAALKYYTYEQFPYQFASIMNDIGITLDMAAKAIKSIDFQNQSAYQKYVTGQLANTIGAYEAALTVFTYDAYPEDYAQVQFNMGLTYSFWAGIQNKSENIAKSIRAYEEALKIYTPEKHPVLYRQVNTLLEKERQRAG